MANPLFDAWLRLNPGQKNLVRYGIPGLVVVCCGYFTWGDLGEIGNHVDDERNGITHREVGLPAFIQINGTIGNQAADTVGKIQAQQSVIARRAKVAEALAVAESEVKSIQDDIPTEEEKTQLRERIQTLGLRKINLNKCTISSVPPVPPSANKKQQIPVPVTYEVDITGKLDGIIDFINELEGNKRILAVQSFTIRPGAVSAPTTGIAPVFADHSAQIKIQTYVRVGTSGGAK